MPLDERRRLRGAAPTAFMQPAESVDEERRNLPKLGLIVVLMVFAGVGFMIVGQPDSVVVTGRRSAVQTWEASRSWTTRQLSWMQRWQYGLQLFDLYSAVRRGQWPASNVGAPRRKGGRRVLLREVSSGRYVRVATSREAAARPLDDAFDFDGHMPPAPGELVADVDLPWIHGGAFELYDAADGLRQDSRAGSGADGGGGSGAGGGDAAEDGGGVWAELNEVSAAGLLHGHGPDAADARWELLSRAEDGQGFVGVSWRAAFLEHIGASLGPNSSRPWWGPNMSWHALGAHWSNFTSSGWFMGALSATGRRSTDATALAVELLPPSPPLPPAGRGCVRTRQIGRVRLRAPGRRDSPGADDWMGGGRQVVVEPHSGALRLDGFAFAESHLPPAEFVVEEVEPLRGVNLGAWLIPERDYTTVAQSSLCDFSTHEGAQAAMEAHVASWIGEEHFEWMARRGINAVRLPLGWWDVLNPEELPDPGHSRAWSEMAPGPRPAIEAIQRVLDWAEQRSISVLLDLHGGPGGQNGKDHSGCVGVAEWHLFSVNNSLAVVQRLLELFGEHSALWGIELLNEPGDLSSAPMEDAIRPALLDYYERAYALIRRTRPDVAVVFCVLYWFDFWAWADELREPLYYNVYLDVHMYTAFDGFTAATPDETVVAAARGFGCRLLQHGFHHPPLVGEWALAVDATASKVTQSFVDAQLCAFGSSFGHFFWTLQMDADAEMAERAPDGTKIGPSPQWDLTKALDATPNTAPDGVASPYAFPDLARHFRGESDAPTLEQIRAGATRPPAPRPRPQPLLALPSATAPDELPPCPYISPTGVALLCGALGLSFVAACFGAFAGVRTCVRQRAERRRQLSKRAMAEHNPLASPLIIH